MHCNIHENKQFDLVTLQAAYANTEKQIGKGKYMCEHWIRSSFDHRNHTNNYMPSFRIAKSRN